MEETRPAGEAPLHAVNVRGWREVDTPDGVSIELDLELKPSLEDAGEIPLLRLFSPRVSSEEIAGLIGRAVELLCEEQAARARTALEEMREKRRAAVVAANRMRARPYTGPSCSDVETLERIRDGLRQLA